jgi:sarcosine oxidase subunit beta
MSKDERIIVIGAGSTGSSVAYHLSKSTDSQILLIDKGGIASGMTSFSTAIVRTHYSNEIVARMAFESRKIFESNMENFGFYKTGMLTVVPSSMKDRMKDNVFMLKRVGIKEEKLSGCDAKGRFPWLKFNDDEDISYEPDSGYADPVATASYFARSAMDSGAEFLKTEVDRIEENQKGGKVILKDGKEISGNKVILCTNIWTNNLLSRSGAGKNDLLPVKVSPHPVIIFKRPGEISGLLPVVNDLANRDYYKPEGHSLLSGGNLRSEMDDIDIDPDNPPMDVPFEYISEYSERISDRIPAMSMAGFHSAYYGMYDNTPDFHPIVDSLSSLGFSNFYCCVGLSGHGFKLAPSLGKIVYRLVKEIKEPALEYFRLARFKDGSSIFKAYEGIGTVG